MTEQEFVGEGVEETPSPASEVPETPETQEAAAAPTEEVSELDALKELVAERTSDLQRLQAEYINYKKRVDRDRALAKQSGVDKVLTDLMPVLDAVLLARSHDDVTGGFKLVADELDKLAARYELVSFGEVGEPFDPQLHDALMQVAMETPVEVTTISQVLQPGYKLGERVIRPARVAVAQPGE